MSAAGQRARAPLEGYRIVDLSSVLMGPYCTRMLADLGADVIKLEDVAGGDTSRGLGVGRRPDISGTFIQLNRGKKSLGVDLKTPRGREICLRLASTADVFVHSIRPKALERLKLEYADLAAANPSVVYCNLLGFGKGGRYYGRPAYDDTVQALCGLAMLQSEYAGQPGYVSSAVADKITGLHAAMAIVSALLQRERDGQGQEIEVAMFETMAAFLLMEHQSSAVFDPPQGPPRYARLLSRDRRPFLTRDGSIAAMVYNDKHWQRFCAIVQQPGLAEDPRFRTFLARSQNAAAYYQLLSQLFRERPTIEWESLLDAAEIPYARLNTLDDLFHDPHLDEVDFFMPLQSPGDGELRVPRPALRLRGTSSGAAAARTPTLGQDTRQLLEQAGYSAREIDSLAADHVVLDAGSQPLKPELPEGNQHA